MPNKQEFVLNASRDALIALVSVGEKFDNTFTDDALFDSLVYGFSKLYDKCANLKET